MFPDNIFLKEKKHADILLDFFGEEKRKEIGLLVSGRRMEQTKTKSKCQFR